MKELIPVTRQALNETETLTCDARALHAFVESKQDFSTWIKSRIAKYGFIEGVDFLLHKFVEQADRQDGRGGREMLGLMNIYLDNRSTVGQVGIPNTERRTPRLCPAPQDDNSGFFCFCQQSAFWRVYELAEQRPGVREAQAASQWPGSVVPSFFVPKTQKTEVPYA